MYSTAPSTATIPDRTEYVQLLAAAVIPAEIFTRMYTVHCTALVLLIKDVIPACTYYMTAHSGRYSG